MYEILHNARSMGWRRCVKFRVEQSEEGKDGANSVQGCNSISANDVEFFLRKAIFYLSGFILLCNRAYYLHTIFYCTLSYVYYAVKLVLLVQASK